jgi:hypothetical protein
VVGGGEASSNDKSGLLVLFWSKFLSHARCHNKHLISYIKEGGRHLLLGLCLNCILYNVHFTSENLPNSVKKTTVSSNAAELGEKNYINNILFIF